MDVIQGDLLSITFPDGRKADVGLSKAVMAFTHQRRPQS